MIPNEETKEILYAIDKATSDINPVLSKAIDFTYKDADETIKRLYGLIPPSYSIVNVLSEYGAA